MFGNARQEDGRQPRATHVPVRVPSLKVTGRPKGSLRLAGALAASMLWGLQAHAADVDVAVVFAVDFSSSIDPDIANLQRKGHAAALTSPEIIAAIVRNYLGCISIAYFEWSSAGRTRIVLPWTRICSLKDAEAAALVIDEKCDTGLSRRGRGRTSVSSAIDVASLLLDQFPGQAVKKVIDISSNGENNDGLPVQSSRLKAVAKGYTINAIAIPTESETPRPTASILFCRLGHWRSAGIRSGTEGSWRLCRGSPAEIGD